MTISGDYTVTAKATDSRGYTATATEDITIYEYTSPTVSGLNFEISGTSCKVTATGACSSVNGLNTAYITFTAVCVSDVSNTQTATYTKTVDEDEWTSSGAYSFSHTFTLDTVQTETYKITFEIEDETGTSATLTKQTGVICFSRLAGGKGAAFFKEAQNRGLWVYGDGEAASVYLSQDVVEAATDTMWKAQNTESGYQIGFGIGESGYNRGIYDFDSDEMIGETFNGSDGWMIYKDADGNIRLGVSGDSIYIGGYPRFTGSASVRTAGYLTSSNTVVYFTIPYISYGASPALEIDTMTIRQGGEYLWGSSDGGAEISSATCTYYRAGYFNVTATISSSSIGGTNNAPVGIYCSYTVS